MKTELNRIGWIGAGRMGHAMAARLLRAGHDVAVWNRTRAKAEDLREIGGVLADSIAELADRDVVFTMVSADADLLQVLLGDGGLLTQDQIPAVIIDSSTVSAETSAVVREAVQARGSTFMVCPVSGNAKVVKAGKLTMAASGPEETFALIEPLLSDIAAAVTYVGEADVARLVKIAHNVFLGVVTQSLAEITVLAEQGGVHRSDFLGFMNRSVMGSTFTRYKTPAMVNLDLAPTFTTTLLRKDLDLGLAAGRALNVALPLAAATQSLVQAAIGRGHAEEDFAALLIEQARSSGLELKPEDVEVDDGLSAR